MREKSTAAWRSGAARTVSRARTLVTALLRAIKQSMIPPAYRTRTEALQASSNNARSSVRLRTGRRQWRVPCGYGGGYLSAANETEDQKVGWCRVWQDGFAAITRDRQGAAEMSSDNSVSQKFCHRV